MTFLYIYDAHSFWQDTRRGSFGYTMSRMDGEYNRKLLPQKYNFDSHNPNIVDKKQFCLINNNLNVNMDII